MKVKDHVDYNEEFPERFGYWGALDSHKLSAVAVAIALRVAIDLDKNSARILVPGLRLALREIAREADV